MLEIYKASAGSGKTYMLTYKVIKLILGYIDDNGIPQLAHKMKERHQHILAVTFTNKATEEMKQRIVKELAVLGNLIPDKVSPYISDLCSYFNASEKTIQEVAAKALKELLHDFSNFNVSTIDSFFQNILRTFTKDAGISYNYGIELNDDSVIKIGVHDLISSLRINSDNPELIAWLEEFTKEQINASKNWNLFYDSNAAPLYSLARYLSNESFKAHKDELLEYLKENKNLRAFKERLAFEIDNCHKEYHNLANAFIGELEKQSASIEDTKGAVKNHIIRFADNDNNNFQVSDAFICAFEDVNNWKKKKCAITDKDALLSILNDIHTTYIGERTYIAMHDNLFALGLLGDIASNIETFRKDNDVILLSDTNDLLKSIINQDDTPFIYERVGIWINHFLIDEFQDTSRLQWDNIKPLLAQSLSYGNENLVIGDIKQSIYRFRNADPSLLDQKIYSDFKGQIESDSSNSYSTNWRSFSNIVKFNNTLFSLLPEMLDFNYSVNEFAIKYENVIQNIAPRNKEKQGYINIQFLSNDSLVDNPIENPLKWTEKATLQVPYIIMNLLDKGYEQKDIAILVNKKYDGANVINSILQFNDMPENCDKKIEFISDESLLLNNSPAIKLVISILRQLDSPLHKKKEDIDSGEPADSNKEKIYSLEVLPSILSVFNKLISQGTTANEALSQSLKYKDEGLHIDKEVLGNPMTKTLFSVVDDIINKYVIGEITEADKPFLEAENPYIYAFVDLVNDYTDNYPSTIHDFLKWWDSHNGSFSILSPASSNAVNIMTIHKSKGLEFPCVLLPIADWELNKTGGLLWEEPKLCSNIPSDIIPPIIPVSFSKTVLLNSEYEDAYKSNSSKNILDVLNKTYVAFTRASEVMYIISNTDKSENIGSYLFSALGSASEQKISQIPTLDNSYSHFIPIEIDIEPINPTIEIGKLLFHKATEKKLPISSFTPPIYSSHPPRGEFSFEATDTLPSKRNEGMLYHKIFSLIRYEADIDLMLRRCVSKGIILKTEKKSFEDKIQEMLSNEEARIWFAKGNKVLNERPISNKGKTFRPDRIIITPENATIVIDYKFGEKQEDTYKKQVKNYMNLLQKAGLKNIVGKIWYPFTQEIITIL